MAEHILVLSVVEAHIVVGHMALHIPQVLRAGGIHNLRLRLHHRCKALESGESLLHHLRQLHQDLDGIDENADVQGIHGQVVRRHLPVGDEPAAVDHRHQVHHALEKQVAPHEAAHAVVVILLGQEEILVAPAEFLPLHILVGEGLDHPDPRQRVLQAGVHIPDLPPVVHEGGLHPLILPGGEEDHEHHQGQQRHRQPGVDGEQADEGAHDLDQGDKKVLRAVVGKFGDIEQVGHQLAHHLSGIVVVIVGK